MKKKLLSMILVCLSTVYLFEGCGGKPTSNVEDNDHKLTVYAWDSNFNIPALRAAEEDYRKNYNPDFELEIIEQPGSADVENAVTLAASSGDYTQLPDMVLFQDHWIQQFVNDYPDAWKNLDDIEINWDGFSEEKLSYTIINGKHYGVPVDNGTAIFAYRVDILNQCGYSLDDMTGCSWNQFIEIGKEVYAKTGKYLLSINGDANDLPYMMLQAEGVSQFKDGKPYIVDNKTLLQVIEVIAKMQKEHVLYIANDWTEYTDKTISGDMVAGVMNGNWIIPTIERVDENKGKWEITTLPTLEGGKEGYASNGGSSIYLTSNCKNDELAKDFLAKTFGGSTKTYDNALLNGGVIGCCKTAASSDVYNEGVEYFNNQPIYSKIVEMSLNVQTIEQNDYHYTCRDYISTAIQEVIDGMEIKDALEDAESNLKFAMGENM